MHFEINRKAFSTALEKCLDVVGVADVNGRENFVLLFCKEGGNSVFISTRFAQTEVEKATVHRAGSIVVEADALSRVAKTSGTELSVVSDTGGARFACGKLKGTVPRASGSYEGFIEPSFVHLKLTLPAVKKVFSAISLKDTSPERSLHLAPRQGIVRIEAGDDYRGVFCVVNIDKQDVNAETMTVPTKALEILPKIFPAQCSLGVSDSVLLVRDERTSIILPLSARQPIDIYGQLEAFLQQTEMIGSFEADVKGFATSIADVVQTIGSDKNQVDLVFETGRLQAEVNCSSSSGNLSSEFDLKSCSMPKGSTTLSLSSSYLKTGLVLFDGDIRVRIYPSFVIIEMLAPEEPIKLQQLALPVIFVSSEGAGAKEEVVASPEPERQQKSPKSPSATLKERKKRDAR